MSAMQSDSDRIIAAQRMTRCAKSGLMHCNMIDEMLSRN